MPTIKIIKRDKQMVEIEAIAGQTLMQNLRDGGVEEVLALCGGCCSCATCHVYVAEALWGTLPAVSDNENDLLDGSDHRTPSSRLSCQLTVTEAWEGAVITVAPED